MSYSSGQDSSATAARKPDPFASLPAPHARRRRFWLVDLLMAPFQDHDERATYTQVGEESEAKSRAGIRANKAWNGNGAPSASSPQWNGVGVNRQAASEAFAVPGVTARGSLFSSVDRGPAGH